MKPWRQPTMRAEPWAFRRVRLLRLSLDEHLDAHDRAAIAEALRRCDAAEATTVTLRDLLTLSRVVAGAGLLRLREHFMRTDGHGERMGADREGRNCGVPPHVYAGGCGCERGCPICEPEACA